MVQLHHPCAKLSTKRSNVGINHQGLICTSWFHWLKKKMEIGSHLNHMWCNKMNPCFSLAASPQSPNIRVWEASSSIFTSWRGSRVECLCAVHFLDSSAQTGNLCYLFFFLSFLPLLVELWVVLERAEAWPVVFRWSNNLFLEGNSLSQVTQWRFTSF